MEIALTAATATSASYSTYAESALSASYAPVGNSPTASYVALNYASKSLQAPLTMSTANTWVDGPAIILPAGGVWFVDAFATYRRASTGATNYSMKIRDGNDNVYAQTSDFQASNNPNQSNLHMSTIVVAPNAMAVTASFLIDNATAFILAWNSLKATGSVATQINAIKIQ